MALTFTACRSAETFPTTQFSPADANACGNLRTVPVDEYLIPPYDSLALFSRQRDGQEAPCTAFRVGDNYVTAAHCVFDPGTLTWSTDMAVCPARYVDDKGCLQAPWKVTDVYLSRGWDVFSVTDQDFAILRTDEPPEGTDLVLNFDLPPQSGLDVQIVGFVGVEATGFDMCELDAEATVPAAPASTTYINGGTLHGMSGGPWITTNNREYASAGLTSRTFPESGGTGTESPYLARPALGPVVDCAQNSRGAACPLPPNYGTLKIRSAPIRSRMQSAGFDAFAVLRSPFVPPTSTTAAALVTTTGSGNNVSVAVLSIQPDGALQYTSGSDPDTRKSGPAFIAPLIDRNQFNAMWPTNSDVQPQTVFAYDYEPKNEGLPVQYVLNPQNTGPGLIVSSTTLGGAGKPDVDVFAYTNSGTGWITAHYEASHQLKLQLLPAANFGQSVALASRMLPASEAGNFILAATTASKTSPTALTLFGIAVPQAADGGGIQFPVVTRDARNAYSYPPAVVFLGGTDLIVTTHRNAADLALVLSVWRMRSGAGTFELRQTKSYTLPGAQSANECRTVSEPVGVPCNLDLVYMGNGLLLGLNGVEVRSWNIDAYGGIQDLPGLILTQAPFGINLLRTNQAIIGYLTGQSPTYIDFAYLDISGATPASARYIDVACLETSNTCKAAN